MRNFNVNVKKNKTEYNFMPTLQMYLLDCREPRPMVIVVPGGGYTEVCKDGDKTVMQYNAAGFHAAVLNYSVEPHYFPEPQRNLAMAIRIIHELHKPNACILYSAVLTTRLKHCETFLLGHVGQNNPENLLLASCDVQVNPKTPPTFLYSTYEDKLTNIENVLYYGESLSKNKIPFELHIFPAGGHCAPWCDETTWAKPPIGRDYRAIKLSIEWLIELFEL